MMKRLLALVALVSGLCRNEFCAAQSAEDFFHQAADVYVNGDTDKALALVEKGLAADPSNAKLNSLKGKLKKQKPPENEAQQNKNDPKRKDQQNNQKDEKEKQDEKDDKPDLNKQEQKPTKIEKAQFSKQEAERILNALKENEKDMLKKYQVKKTLGKAKPDKDW
jgi:Ca-activated chloride channel homolog